MYIYVYLTHGGLHYIYIYIYIYLYVSMYVYMYIHCVLPPRQSHAPPHTAAEAAVDLLVVFCAHMDKYGYIMRQSSEIEPKLY